MARNDSRPLNRFFLPAGASLEPGRTVAIDTLAQQLLAVLRMSAGDEIILLDGSGNEYHASIQTLSQRHATALVISARLARAEPAVPLTLYQCSLKLDKFEWVLQKGTELGVSRFVPVISSRSVVRPATALLKKYDRWRAILREAAEQCERGRVPELAEPLDWPNAVCLLAGAGFLPWKADEAVPSLRVAVGTSCSQAINPKPQRSLLIGPEGGITTDEVAQARLHGWQIVTLGPRVLRAETAALAAITIVMDH